MLLGSSKRTLQRLVESGALQPAYVSPYRPRFRIEDIAEYRLRDVKPKC